MNTQTINGKEYTEIDGCFIPCDMVNENQPIKRPQDVLHFVSEYKAKEQEYFIVLTLDSSNKLIKKHEITKGLVNRSLAHSREVFRPSIIDNACYIMLVHNHPSGDLSISQADMATTNRLVEASKIIGIPIVDHLIVSKEGFVSIREDSPQYFM